MHSLSKEEEDKAALSSRLTLIERYAASGTNPSILKWLEHKINKISSDLQSRQGQLRKQSQDNDAQARPGR